MSDLFDDVLLSEDNNTPSETKYLELMIQQIYNTDNIEVKTDLNQAQINAITKALIFADKYNISILKDIAKKHMELLISKDRKGRMEFTQISAKMNNERLESETTLFNKLIGK